MNYGVTITSGAQPWQIFGQNDEGFASISIRGEFRRVHQSFELPLIFTELQNGTVTVKARIAREDTGESVIAWTICELTEDNKWCVTFAKVPAGGLYRIETYMEYEGWDGLSTTRGDMVHQIGVGDIFVIAGQSNAAGRAKTPVEDTPELGVHILRPSALWDLASHPLGDTTHAIYIGNFENHNTGHSPWLHFAKRLKKELGYPIGLVPCAYGGSPLRWWNPEENGELLNNMQAHLGDVKPKGVLWYQGEADSYEDGADTYLARFSAFINAVRTRLQSPDLYFFTIQLNRCVTEATEENDHRWGKVRQAQVDAAATLHNVAVVPSNDLSLYDSIHNSSEGNLIIGQRTACAALTLLYGKSLNWQAPEVQDIKLCAPDTVCVTFSRIANWLNPYDVPPALLPIDAQDENGLVHPVGYTTGQNSLTITFARALVGKAVLHGAWRANTGGLIPCDCMRMPMLSFYALAIN